MATKPPTAKCVLTDVLIRSLKPAEAGRRYAVRDAIVPGLSVRVTDRNGKTYLLTARWRGAVGPASLALGRVGEISLAAARTKAREWLELRASGNDPREVERKRLAAARAAEADTFGATMEEYLARVVRKRRHGRVDERDIRADILPLWKDRPLAGVSRRDVVELIDRIVDRSAPSQARHVYEHIRSFHNWAIARGIYGIETSPCDRLRLKELIGKKASRDRVLTDEEIAAFWHASGELGYPSGSAMRLLLLTGQRKNEIGKARWSEIDLKARTLTIAAARYKSNRAHTVPLSDDAMLILDELPRFRDCDFLFSVDGVHPANGFIRAKARTDALMAAELGHAVPGWVLHDLRRTVRTRLSGLRVRTEVAEFILGHARQGIQSVYDRHEYADEMREALEQWSVALRRIVEPPPDNLLIFDRARRGNGRGET